MRLDSEVDQRRQRRSGYRGCDGRLTWLSPGIAFSSWRNRPAAFILNRSSGPESTRFPLCLLDWGSKWGDRAYYSRIEACRAPGHPRHGCGRPARIGAGIGPHPRCVRCRPATALHVVPRRVHGAFRRNVPVLEVLPDLFLLPSAGGAEAVYLDMHAPIRMAQFAPLVPARGAMFSARKRAALAGEATAPEAITEEEFYAG